MGQVKSGKQLIQFWTSNPCPTCFLNGLDSSNPHPRWVNPIWPAWFVWKRRGVKFQPGSLHARWGEEKKSCETLIQKRSESKGVGSILWTTYLKSKLLKLRILLVNGISSNFIQILGGPTIRFPIWWKTWFIQHYAYLLSCLKVLNSILGPTYWEFELLKLSALQLCSIFSKFTPIRAHPTVIFVIW